MGERIWLAATQPLWLDETWTAAIVSTPGPRGFWREVYLDVNAPLYYLFMRGWSHLFGLSDLALRIPGLLLAPAAAGLALWGRLDGAPASVRRGWAGLLFFWWGCGQFLDARCYALLLALCTLQVLAFVRLLRAPSLGRALVWTALCALAILCQYYALFIGLAQGLVYLWVHRGRAARTWPALIALAPAAGWMAYHAPRLAQYGRPDVAWHQSVDLPGGLALASFAVGGYSPWLAIATLAVIAGAACWPDRAAPVTAAGEDALGPSWRAAAAGLLALALILLTGVLKPTLTARYLIPVVPSILLGVVLCCAATRHARLAIAALIGLFAAVALDPSAFAVKVRQGAPYGDEAASDFLMARGVTDVAFVWDHPAAKIMDPVSLTRVGDVFFNRAGAKVAVTPIVVSDDEDASLRLVRAALGARPGIIWIFDRTSRTAARLFPPHVNHTDPRWACQTFGDGVSGSLACIRNQ
jgi:hypothetical protein